MQRNDKPRITELQIALVEARKEVKEDDGFSVELKLKHRNGEYDVLEPHEMMQPYIYDCAGSDKAAPLIDKESSRSTEALVASSTAPVQPTQCQDTVATKTDSALTRGEILVQEEEERRRRNNIVPVMFDHRIRANLIRSVDALLQNIGTQTIHDGVIEEVAAGLMTKEGLVLSKCDMSLDPVPSTSIVATTVSNPSSSAEVRQDSTESYEIVTRSDGDRVIQHSVLGEIVIFPPDMDVPKAIARKLNELRRAIRTQMEYLCLPTTLNSDQVRSVYFHAERVVRYSACLIFIKICRYYFSPEAWKKESFLPRHMDSDGWIAIGIPLAFQRMAQLLRGFKTNEDFILHSLEKSTLLEVCLEKKAVRQKPAVITT